MVNEQKFRHAFMFTACFILLRLGVGSGAKCGDVFNKPLSACCPTEYLHSCCPEVTKPCNTSATMRPLKPQLRGAVIKPFCMKPQNSTACEAGFYLDNVAKQVEPCPDGFYCAQDQVCIVPCPEGAYCVKDKLVDSTEKSPPLCRESRKCCSPSQSIPLFDPRHSKLICPGAKSPVPCPSGSYCRKVTVKEACTRGHFCRNGTVNPQDCPILSICKKGSSAPESAAAGIVLILVILGLMLFLVYCFNHEERLAFLFERHVIQRCREIQMSSNLKVQDPLMQLTSWFTVVKEYRQGASPKNQTITIRFENLSLVLKKTKKDVLQGVTGQMLPGEVTAVMGPSGSGKTTLLNTLCGKAYYGKRGGQLYINDKEVKDLGVYRNITGFVPQEDVMHRSLTVNEVLIYQANLRLPSTISSQEKKNRIHEVLDLLDLKGVKNTKIGDEESRGISGGQRKRVNIGMELVTDPTLLFLDEPTSGLDSTSSLMVVDALKAVAEEKKLTIVCVIHQPRYEIFSKFHKVLFLAPGGKTVFQGTVPEAENYFDCLGFEKPDKVNPADFYMDVIGGVVENKQSEFTTLPESWEQHACQNSAGSEGDENAAGDPDSPVRREADVTLDLSFNGSANNILIRENQDQNDRVMPNFLIQFVTFLRREIRLQFRLSRSLLLDQFLVLLAGGTLGALRKEAPLDEFFTLVTLSSLAIGLTAMLSSLRCFGSNRATFWREAASGINRVSYFMAVNFAQIPIILITPVVYLSLLYPLVSPRGLFRFHYAATLGAQFACTGMGYCISAIFNPKNSQMASVTLALICSLVSGSSPTLCKMDGYTFFGPLLYNLSYCRWYLEALFEKEANRYPDVLAPYVHRLSTRNGYTLDNYSICVGVLFAMGFAYRALALLFMLFTNRGKQQ